MCDNTTAISCINKIGTSHSMDCHYLTVTIWVWVWILIFSWQQLTSQGKEILLQIETLGFNLEWMLSPRYLHQSLNLLSFKPDIDLFATQINRQFSDYVAYRPDPEAKCIDAFTIDWSHLKFYAFPPIAIISRVLSKISQDEAEGIIDLTGRIRCGILSCWKCWYQFTYC